MTSINGTAFLSVPTKYLNANTASISNTMINMRLCMLINLFCAERFLKLVVGFSGYGINARSC